MFKHIAVLALACTATACATPEQNAALECGGGIAALSFVLCKVTGGDTGQCAAIGAGTGALGGAACYGLASHLDKRRAELAGKENDLNAQLEYIRGVNADSERYNEQLRQSVVNVTKQTDTVVARIQQNQMTSEQIADAKRAIDRQVVDARHQLDAQKRAWQEAKQFQLQHPNQSPELDAEIHKQEQILAATQRGTQALASQSQRF
ncbi:hypothetical protein FSB08_17185 [Paraburkholderia sp. JPY432]|uniref:hypothetical protein n=1 Tax=Paraburkholderia youngii TaxID=2782701 RepID=UPI001594F16E|nr:hypothetical protein [Paraburkholderia youngii]NVH74237.1 hypothetical protein [Paraburkholderia youngii]